MALSAESFVVERFCIISAIALNSSELLQSVNDRNAGSSSSRSNSSLDRGPTKSQILDFSVIAGKVGFLISSASSVVTACAIFAARVFLVFTGRFLSNNENTTISSVRYHVCLWITLQQLVDTFLLIFEKLLRFLGVDIIRVQVVIKTKYTYNYTGENIESQHYKIIFK